MGRTITKVRNRFSGATLADKAVDVGQRWWPLMTGVYTAAIAGYTKASSLFSGFGWLDAIAFGFVGALFLTCVTLVSFAAYRHLRPPVLPSHDRDEFRDEVVNLADLVGGQEPFVSNKKFVRCIIEGPGQVKFHHGVTNILCSAPQTQIVQVEQGANITGAVVFLNVMLDRCHFHNIALIGTHQDVAQLRENTEDLTLGQWKERRWQTA